MQDIARQVEYHDISQDKSNTTRYHKETQVTKWYHEETSFTTRYHEAISGIMEYHEVSKFTTGYHEE
jgi:hypothetical protein